MENVFETFKIGRTEIDSVPIILPATDLLCHNYIYTRQFYTLYNKTEISQTINYLILIAWENICFPFVFSGIQRRIGTNLLEQNHRVRYYFLTLAALCTNPPPDSIICI